MASKVDCPHCKMKLNLAPGMFGTPIQCPGCKNSTTFTKSTSEPAPFSTPPQSEKGATPESDFRSAATRPDLGSINSNPDKFGRTTELPKKNPVLILLGCIGIFALLVGLIAFLIAMLLPANQVPENKKPKTDILGNFSTLEDIDFRSSGHFASTERST